MLGPRKGCKGELSLALFSFNICISLDQNKLFVSESKVPLTQLAKWYKEPTKQFSEL